MVLSPPRSVQALFAVLLLSGCGQNLTATEHVSKAKEYKDKGELKPALIELSSAVQKDPNSMEGRWLLAQVAAEMGEGARAEKEIKKAMELGLSQASGLPTLVKALFLQGQLDRMLQESSALPPNMSKAAQADILGLRGQAYIVKSQWALAEQTLQQALQIKSDSASVLIGMTALNGFRRNYEVARQWVNKALKADANSPDAWSALGDLEKVQGRLVEAEKAYGQAIKHRTSPYVEQIKRAQVRIQLKKFTEAAADLKALKAAGLKDHPYVNYVDGLNYFAQKNYRDAAESFRASYAVDPDFLPNRIYLATTQLLLGNTEQALNFAQQIAATSPRSKAAQGLLGSVLISRAEYEGAKGALQKILDKFPNEPQALGMMTTIALREGDTAKGLGYAQKLASLDPDSRQAQDMLTVAKLMAGQDLASTISQAGDKALASGDVYTREFMLALADFRDGKLKHALDRAKALSARYPDKVDPPKLAAAVYLAAGQWDEGKAELEKALKIQPNEASATRNLAKVEAIKGNYRQSRELLQPLVKQRPDDAEALRILATAEYQLGNPAGALVILEQASKNRPDDLRLIAEIAQSQLKMGRADKVLELTRGLVDNQFRQQPVLLELRGKAQLLTGDFAGAVGSFEKLTRLMPNSAVAHFHYANALASRGDNIRGRKVLEQAIKLDPRYLPARVGEIKMFVQLNEVGPARKALAKLRQDFGDRVEVLGIEGWFALGTRDFVTAEQKLTAALRKKPGTELLLLTTRAQWAQKKQAAALKTMLDWLKTRPNDVAVLMQLAGAYLDMGRESEALATYNQVVKLAPTHVPALNNMAWLNRDKAPQEAINYAQKAYQLAPKDPYVLDTLGMLALQNGDLNRAASLLSDASSRAPDDVQIQLRFGKVLLKQKRLAEAKKVFNTIVKIAPRSTVATEARALSGAIK